MAGGDGGKGVKMSWGKGGGDRCWRKRIYKICLYLGKGVIGICIGDFKEIIR